MRSNLNRSGIYSITSPSGNVYLGCARLIRRRWHQHKIQLRSGKHKNFRLQQAWSKYGESQMIFKVILFCREVDLIFFEQRLIDLWKPYYNLANTAHSTRWTDEARQAVSLRQVGRRLSEETRARMSASRTGREVSEETRMKLAAQKGWKHTEEAKQKMRGRTFSVEHRRKLSEARSRNAAIT